MATQKEMREMREEVINLIENTEFANYVFEGIVTDGVLLYNEGLDTYVVVKPIVKKEGFDPEDALQEYEDKQKAKEEREKAKLEKAIARAEKVKAKLEEKED